MNLTKGNGGDLSGRLISKACDYRSDGCGDEAKKLVDLEVPALKDEGGR